DSSGLMGDRPGMHAKARDETAGQAEAITKTGQQSGAGARRETLGVAGDFNRDASRGSLHLYGDLSCGDFGCVATTIIPAQRVTVFYFKHKSRGLRGESRLASPVVELTADTALQSRPKTSLRDGLSAL
ncbi:MAG: hypothetical protein U1E22_01515, partial [Coriobacteriia bacterium]|nr:hypothetical protein [Coriobacteriia bacterium]